MVAVETILVAGTAATPSFVCGKHAEVSLLSSAVGLCSATHGLSSQVVRPHTAVSATATVAATEQPDGMAYEMHWAALHPASVQIVHPGTSAFSSTSGSAADALSVLQSGAATSGAVFALSPPTLRPVTSPAGLLHTAGSAALQGMMKTLAQELPSLSVGVASTDTCAAPWQLGVSGHLPQHAQHDVYGTATVSGAEFGPRMLRAGASTTKSPLGDVTSGSQLILGGSGVLAGHIAAWLLTAGAPGVVLSSRSGAVPGTVFAGLSSSDVPIIITSTKADAAIAEDVRALFLRAEVRWVFHAGGTLADATLPNQTISGLRQVGFNSILHCIIVPLACTMHSLWDLFQTFPRSLRPRRWRRAARWL